MSSLRATQCSISVLRSLVSVASPSQPTYSACVFSADSLHVSQLELTASDSVLQSVSSKRSCSLSVVAGTQQNVLDTTIAVTRSDVTAVAKAAACCASIVSASSNQVTNLTIHAVLTHCNARADADAVAACMGVTSTISFVIATQLDFKIQQCTVVASASSTVTGGNPTAASLGVVSALSYVKCSLVTIFASGSNVTATSVGDVAGGTVAGAASIGFVSSSSFVEVVAALLNRSGLQRDCREYCQRERHVCYSGQRGSSSYLLLVAGVQRGATRESLHHYQCCVCHSRW